MLMCVTITKRSAWVKLKSVSEAHLPIGIWWGRGFFECTAKFDSKPKHHMVSIFSSKLYSNIIYVMHVDCWCSILRRCAHWFEEILSLTANIWPNTHISKNAMIVSYSTPVSNTALAAGIYYALLEISECYTTLPWLLMVPVFETVLLILHDVNCCFAQNNFWRRILLLRHCIHLLTK